MNEKLIGFPSPRVHQRKPHYSDIFPPLRNPLFRYYNKWVSLAGTALCIGVMVLMDYRTALATLACVVLLYAFVRARRPGVNWGSSSQSQSFVTALKAVQTLSRVEDHVKNYRPKLMVMTGDPRDRYRTPTVKIAFAR